jgi:ferritin-like metal-binding protein YciE
MAEAGTLHDAFIDELRDTYDAEKQLTKALSKLAKASSNPKLREAFETHLEETQGQIERLEQVFESLDEKVRGKHCDGIAGIIEEGKSIMEEDFDDTTMDASLIAAGQRAEHYEMAAYGTRRIPREVTKNTWRLARALVRSAQRRERQEAQWCRDTTGPSGELTRATPADG